MLVSVIIPCYNAEKTIIRALDCIFAQTYKKIEIICVNDGSKDNTDTVLNKYRDRITIINIKNSGAAAARNAGLNIAKGEFIQFLDADDIILPEKIEHQVNLIIAQNKDIAFVASGCFVQTGNKRILKHPTNDIWVGLLLTKLGNTCANLFSFKALKLVNGWAESLKSSQEYDLMFRIVQQNDHIIIDKKPLTIIYKTSSSISSTKRNLNDHNFYRAYSLRKRMIDYLDSKSMLNNHYLELYHQKTFKLLQFLYNDYEKEAINLKKLYIPKNFEPTTDLNSKTYIILYKILGFKNLHYIKKLLNKLI